MGLIFTAKKRMKFGPALLLSLFICLLYFINPIHAQGSTRYLDPVFDEVQIEKDVFFTEVTNYKGEKEKLLLDVYSPSGDMEKSRPAIMWIHGGGFKDGVKEQNYIVALATAMAKRGYVCFSISYRQKADSNSPVSYMDPIYLDAVADALAAYNWIGNHSEQYRINKNQITIGGGSAGGITSILLCYGKNTRLTAKGEMALIDLWGSPIQRGNQYCEITKTGPPTLIIHGTKDQYIPYFFSEVLADELHKNGVYSGIHPLIGVVHEAVSNNPELYTNEITDYVAGFLYHVLSGNTTFNYSLSGNAEKGEDGIERYFPGKYGTYSMEGVGFQMNYVPGGLTFPTNSYLYSTSNGKTAINSTISTVPKAYWIAETEVTYQLWSIVYTWAINHGYSFANSGVKGSNGLGSNLQPVTTISWRDALIWCNALTEYYNIFNHTNLACVYYTDPEYKVPIRNADSSNVTTKNLGTEDNPFINPNAKGFRLPAKEEWELAARYIGTKVPVISPLSHQAEQIGGFYFTPLGYASGATDGYKNITATSRVAVYGEHMTANIKSKAPNSIGVYDMCGNVKEFCFDWFPGLSGSIRMVQGGGYFDDLYFMQVGQPSGCFPEGTYCSIGFRFVRTR